MVGVLWRDVFVPNHVVASDGFTTAVGGTVEMSLMLFCRFRTGVAEVDDRLPSVTSAPGGYSHPDDRRVYEIVGRAAAVESSLWADGWMLDVDGLGIYVNEADAGPSPGVPTYNVYREAASDPAVPVPDTGTWTRARGQLSIAEAYESGAYEPEADLLRRASRPWLVRRIVRLDGKPGRPGPLRGGRGLDVTVVNHAGLRNGNDWTTAGYLLDLEQACGNGKLADN